MVLCYPNNVDLLVGLFIRAILKLRGVPENLSMISVMAWLFNPFTFTIGTRGNCEPIVCALILWVFICLMNGVSFFLCIISPSVFCIKLQLLSVIEWIVSKDNIDMDQTIL